MNNWYSEFRNRMDDFSKAQPDGAMPVSIKVGVQGGCFHREHSPKAYRIIDEYLSTVDSDVRFQIEEHESGPEILVYLAVAASGLQLAKSIVELITAIIKARSEGIKRGDHPSEPLKLIVRGHEKGGEYFEETVLQIPNHQSVTSKQIEDVLKSSKTLTQKKKTVRKRISKPSEPPIQRRPNKRKQAK